MSLKPPKKSDLDKDWMKPRRDCRKKLEPEYHLIITEGTKTEPYYFRAMADVINRTYPNRIRIDVGGSGENTVSLFQRAKHAVLEASNGYKHVWVVYDTDDFPAEQINQTAQLCARESNDETVYHAIWSNQCIELWFLLHFSFMHSDIDRRSYAAKLTDILSSLGFGEYAKNRTDMYEILSPYAGTAIANAKKLEEMNGQKLPSEATPGTEVHKLLEKLKPYL